jgi:uncharacterized protein
MTLVLYAMLYLGVGALVGVMAGLLGIGGGIIIVPLLSASFAVLGLTSDNLHHLALGTSLATIMFTSIASFRAHHAKGGVAWPVVRRVAPGIVVGTLGGSWVAAQLSTAFLKGFFVVFLYYVAVQLFLNFKPKAHRDLPGWFGCTIVGLVIGGISSLVGIGGGTMSVPFLLWCNVDMYIAIGTSAAIGFPIALAGTVGYLLNGLQAEGLPPYSLGFIYLPALVGIALASSLTAAYGVKLAHRLPVATLKKFFALFIVLVATRMLLGLI